MRLEIIHDTIAKQVFEKASTEARTRRKIEKHIREAYEAFDERGAKLTQDDLDYIQPYLAQVDISEEESAFIQNGRKTLLAARRRKRFMVFLIVLILAVATAVSLWFAFEANEKEAQVQAAYEKLQNATEDISATVVENAKQDIYHLRYEQALQKLQEVHQQGHLRGEVARGFMEIAFVYSQTGQDHVARPLIDTVASLTGKQFSRPGSLREYRDALTHLDEKWGDSIYYRYFPRMITVEGNAKIASFYICHTEITNWQYYLFVADIDSAQAKKPAWGYNGDHPIVYVNWYDANAYARWLSKKTGLTYTLPTDKQWEYAARGGLKSNGFTYSGSDELGLVAWHKGNSEDRAQAVAGKLPNELGIYDMSGNVWEWCQDPRGTSDRSVRGASWFVEKEWRFKLSSRPSQPISDQKSGIGFRLTYTD